MNRTLQDSFQSGAEQRCRRGTLAKPFCNVNARRARVSLVQDMTSSMHTVWKSLIAMISLVAWSWAADAFAQSRNLVTEFTDARQVYVPLDEFDIVTERDKHGALLTKKKFEELLSLARAHADKASATTRPLVLTSNHYQARIDGDQLLLTVTAQMTQFYADWQSIRFPTQDLSIERATLGDEPAMIARNPDRSVTLFSDRKGTHAIRFELSTNLQRVGWDWCAQIPSLGAPSGSLSLTLPPGKRLLVDGSQLLRPSPIDTAAEYQVALGGADGIRLQITDRAIENEVDLLTFATTDYRLNVVPNAVTWQAMTKLQVFGKSVHRLMFSVPRTLEITMIESPGLRGWDLSNETNNRERTTITLTFAQPFDGWRKISFHGVMAVESGKPWIVPPLTIPHATSHTGWITIPYPDGVRLHVEQANGVRRTIEGRERATTIPDNLSRQNAAEFLRFETWQPDFQLRFTTQPKQREVQSAMASVLDVNATGLDLQTALTVETHFAPLFELDVRLSADWTLLSAMRDDQPLTWQLLTQEAGVNQLRILLDPPLAAEATGLIKLSLRRDVPGWPVEAEPITVGLPELFLPQSSLTEGMLVVRGDDDLDLTASELHGLDTMPLQADYERLRFQSQDTRYGGQLKMTRKPTRLAVQTVTFGRLDPQTAHTFLQATVDVEGGGVRTMQVGLPESTGTSLRFQSQGTQIVEQKPMAPLKGERIWVLRFDRRVRGRIILTCDIELPRGDAVSVEIPQPRFVDVERQNGFFAVEAGSEQRLTTEAKGRDGTALIEVDPVDLPAVDYRPQERIVAVYRNVSAEASLTLRQERFDTLAVPAAVCRRLDVTSVLGHTGVMHHRAHFQLTAVGVQGLRITLPNDCSLWATLVDGKPVEVRGNGDTYLVPLAGISSHPRSDGAEESATKRSRQLQLLYRSAVPALTFFGTVQQKPPELSVHTGQGSDQAVEVLDHTWTVHYPSETRLVSSRGPWEPLQKLDETSLLGQINAGFNVPTLGQLGWQLLAVVGTLGVIVLLLKTYHQRCLAGSGLLTIVILSAATVPLLISQLQQSRRPARPGVDTPTAVTAGLIADPAAQTIALLGEPLPPQRDTPKRASEQTPTAKAVDQPIPFAADKPRSKGPAFQDPKPKEMSDELTLDDHDEPMNLPQTRPPLEEEQQAQHKGDGKRTQEKSSGDVLGLLSLAIDLTAPSDSQEKTFRYLGADSGRSQIGLQIGYVDENSVTNLRVFLMILVVSIGWFLRTASRATKVTFSALGLTIPFALLPLVPVSLQVVLDGMCCGVLAVNGFWLMRGIVCCLESCCLRCCRPGATNPELPTVLVLVAVLITNQATFAEEPAAKQVTDPTVSNVLSPPTGPERPRLPAPPPTSLIIPFETGTDPLAADRVFLPWEKFTELYRLAHPEKPLTQTDPPNSGIVEALYAAKIGRTGSLADESTVDVHGRFVVQNQIKGPLLVPLPLGPVVAREVTVDGNTAALIVEQGRFNVPISTPGLHVIDFNFSIMARLSEMTGSFTLPLLAVPSGKLSFTLPATGLSLQINGLTTKFRRVTHGNSSSIELPIDTGGDLSIAWQPELAKSTDVAVVQVDSVQTMTLSNEGILVRNGYQYRIRRGTVAEVSFSIPESLRLMSVEGSDVGGWEIQGQEVPRTLRVIFSHPIADTTTLFVNFHFDTKIGAQPIAIEVPSLTPLGISNEQGHVALFASDQFLLRAETVQSLTQIDGDIFKMSRPIPPPFTNDTPQLAYRFSKRPFVLSLRATRQESQAKVTAQQAAFVTRRKQQLTTRLIYDLTGAPRSSLRLSLPKGFVVLALQATNLRDWSIGRQGESSTLTLDLDAPRLGLTEVVLTGTVARDGDPDTVTLSFPTAMDATKVETSAGVWLDEGFDAILDQLSGWRSMDATTVDNAIKAVRPNFPIQFAFVTSNTAPNDITLQWRPRTPQLTANGLTMVTVTDVALIHTLALQWQIEGGTTDSLTFTTPNSLAGKLVFTGNGIRETTHVAADNDRTRWVIWLRTPVRGKYFVTAVATLPPPTTEVVAPIVVLEKGARRHTAAADQESLTAAMIEGQQHYVLLINSSIHQLTSADVSLTESVQRDDVPILIDQTLVDQATELVRLKQGLNALKWTLQTFTQTPSAPASVNIADLTSVVSRDGTYRAQAVYTIKNRTRQFLALKLPTPSQLLSVFVENKPARAVTTTRNGQAIQLIALPKTSVASLSFPVQVVWRGTLRGALPNSASVLREEFSVPAPEVIRQRADSEFGIPVAQTRWTVYLPDDLDAKLVPDASSHNLTWQTIDRSDRLYEKAAIQELNDLLGVVEQSDSSRTRYEAMNNLKQLGLGIQTDSDLSDPEFNRQKRDALRRFNDLQNKVHIDHGRKSVSIEGQPKGPRDQPKGIETQTEKAHIFESAKALAQNTLNNRNLLESNSAQERSLPAGHDVTGFAFDSKDKPIKNDVFQGDVTQFHRGTSEISSSRRGTVEQRKFYQTRNNDNLHALNLTITSRRQQALDRRRETTPDTDGLKSQKNLNRLGEKSQSLAEDADNQHALAPSVGDPSEDSKTDGQDAKKSGSNLPKPDPMPTAGRVEAGTPTAGLSLDFDLPTTGQKLVFSKTGGDPQLTLAIRSQESLRQGLGLVWAIVWLSVGLSIVLVARAKSNRSRHLRRAIGVVSLLGVIGYLILPRPFGGVSFLLFVLASVLVRGMAQKATVVAK